MKTEKAKEIISRFEDKNVLVVGDVMLDRYIFGKVERLNPEAPVPILHVKGERFATGGAGNTAKNVTALGAKAALVGVVGHDTAAEKVRQAARREGYEDQLVSDERPTTAKIRYTVGSQQMLRVDYEEVKNVAGSVQQALQEKIEEAAKEADVIIVSDYAKGVITEGVAQTIMKVGKPIMADIKPSRVDWFSGATWFSPNKKEAYEFLGIGQYDNGGISDEQLAQKLKERFNATVFLTLSAQGMFVAGETERVYVLQDHAVEVADTSGAGDTAAVVIVLAKLAGASDVEAAQLANAAGAVVVSKGGAVGVTQEELLNMIEHKHG